MDNPEPRDNGDPRDSCENAAFDLSQKMTVAIPCHYCRDKPVFTSAKALLEHKLEKHPKRVPQKASENHAPTESRQSQDNPTTKLSPNPAPITLNNAIEEQAAGRRPSPSPSTTTTYSRDMICLPHKTASRNLVHWNHFRQTSGQLLAHQQEGSPQEPLKMVLKPDTRPTSQALLVAEVKGIYAGLVILEKKCIQVVAEHVTSTREAPPGTRPTFNNLQSDATYMLFKMLLHEHYDFLLASQHPSAGPGIRRLAIKYAMPSRLWRHCIHSYLDLLRIHLPYSLNHILEFIYLVYHIMTLMFETVPAFEDTWIEYLGDLGRHRMAIEDHDIRERECWTRVSMRWYFKASYLAPTLGRLYHHIAILAKPNVLQQLFFYGKALSVSQPFPAAKDSMSTSFKPILRGEQSIRLSPLINAYIKIHAMQINIETSLPNLDEFIGRLDCYISYSGQEFLEQGYYIAILNCFALLSYRSPGGLLFRALSTAEDLTSNTSISIDERESHAKLEDSMSESDTANSPFDSLQFKAALQLFARTLEIICARTGDPIVLSFLHITLIFLLYVSRYPLAIRLLESEIPWKSLASMLNSLLKSYDAYSQIEGDKLPIPEKKGFRPAPEEFAIRGLEWDPYLPMDWFENGSVEDENQYKEDISMDTSYRLERVLWLGCQLAQDKKWFRYNSIEHEFFPLEADSDAQNTTDIAAFIGADTNKSLALETSVNCAERLHDWGFVDSQEISQGKPRALTHAGSVADTEAITDNPLITQETKSTADIETMLRDPLLSQETKTIANTVTVVGDVGADADKESFSLKTSVTYPYPEVLQDWVLVDSQEINEGDPPTPSHAEGAAGMIGNPMVTQETESPAGIDTMMRDLSIARQTKHTADVENLIVDSAPPTIVSMLPLEQRKDAHALAVELRRIFNVYVNQHSNNQSKKCILNLSPLISLGVHLFNFGYPSDSEFIFAQACELCKDERVNKNDLGLDRALGAVERIYRTVKLPWNWATLKDRLSCLLSFSQRQGGSKAKAKAKPYRDCPSAAAFPLRCQRCDKKTAPYVDVLVHVWIQHRDDFPKDFVELWKFVGEILDASRSVSDKARVARVKTFDQQVDELYRQVNDLQVVSLNQEGEDLERLERNVANLDRGLKDRFEVDFYDLREETWEWVQELKGGADCEILQLVD